MKEYVKRPVRVKAVQYLEHGKLVKGMCNSQSCLTSGNTAPHVHTIHEGQVVNLTIGDWVIPEADGEHYYPVKPNVFEETYYEVH